MFSKTYSNQIIIVGSCPTIRHTWLGDMESDLDSEATGCILVHQDTTDNHHPPSLPVSLVFNADPDAKPRIVIPTFQFLRSGWWYGADA